MSEIEKDWEAKWEDGINLTEVTKDELTNYVRYKIYVYTEIRNQLDFPLWESFQWGLWELYSQYLYANPFILASATTRLSKQQRSIG